MKILMLTALASAAFPALAAAQDDRLWTNLAETRSFQGAPPQGDRRGRGGQVVEEYYTPRVRGSLSFWGRVSFPSETDVTTDGFTYGDFFDPGLGLSVEGDLLTFVTPHFGIGGYLTVGWDRFNGQTVDLLGGFVAKPGDMDLTSVIVGGKVMQRLTPFMTWEGRMGLGVVHYASVKWSGFDPTSTPQNFSNEELFRVINRAVGEIGGRVGFGNPYIEADVGIGVRVMGGAARGKDAGVAIDPDILTTFTLELGLTLRF